MYNSPFFIVERAGFVQDGIRNANFAYVMQQGCQEDQVPLFVWQPNRAGCDFGKLHGAISVDTCALIVRCSHGGECQYGAIVRAFHPHLPVFCHNIA